MDWREVWVDEEDMIYEVFLAEMVVSSSGRVKGASLRDAMMEHNDNMGRDYQMKRRLHDEALREDRER